MHLPTGNFSRLNVLIGAALLYLGFAEKGPCELSRFLNGCCPDTQWNIEISACIECPPGNHGENCSKQCQYPYYGKKCDGNCLCETEHCNYINGCKTANTTQSVSNVSSATYDASKFNTTNKLFLLLIIVTSSLVMIGIAYIAVLFVGRQWNRTEREIEREL